MNKQEYSRYYYRKFHRANPDYNRQYYIKTRSRQLRAAKERKRLHPYKSMIIRRESLWTYRGIKNFTWELFLRLVRKQRGKCKICQRKFGLKLVVDHSHKTGQVRGGLCRNCNCKLEWAEDNLKFIIKYLRLK